jgi:hypothetical protein
VRQGMNRHCYAAGGTVTRISSWWVPKSHPRPLTRACGELPSLSCGKSPTGASSSQFKDKCEHATRGCSRTGRLDVLFAVRLSLETGMRK